jgi:hypothetical protein
VTASILAQVRAYVSDDGRGNTLSGEAQDFSDPDIVAAAEAAVRSYNSLPPVDLFCRGVDLRYNFWFDGIAAHLYQLLEQRLMRQDLDFTAGEVVVSPVAKQLATCGKLLTTFRTRFEEAAGRHKITQNLRGARGRVG